MAKRPFTFICGDDDYLVTEKARVWFEAATRELEDSLSKEVVDGRAANVAEVEDAISRFTSAVQTLSLFGERKVVWLKDVNFMADSPTGRAQGTLDLLDGLKALLQGLDPEQVAVLITAQPVDKRRSFYKWCQKTADFTAMAVGKDGVRVCVDLIREECEAAGVSMTPAAMELLIEKVSGHTRLIVEETRKLATYAGAGAAAIDERLVTELVPNFGDADFFEAADAFYSLKLAWTLEALRRHFFTNNESRPLLGSLQSRNRLLIQLRALLDTGAIRPGGLSKTALESVARSYARHFSGSDEKSPLNVFTQNPWYLSRLVETAKRVPLKKLISFQIAFAEAFEAIIERPNEQEEVCRELAIQCLA
jgi:DNA polymerase-3 subunit delta